LAQFDTKICLSYFFYYFAKTGLATYSTGIFASHLNLYHIPGSNLVGEGPGVQCVATIPGLDLATRLPCPVQAVLHQLIARHVLQLRKRKILNEFLRGSARIQQNIRL
jgi:hypothetical protein